MGNLSRSSLLNRPWLRRLGPQSSSPWMNCSPTWDNEVSLFWEFKIRIQFIFIHVELQHASRGTATCKPWQLGATIQTGKQRSYSVCRDMHKENLQSQRDQGEKETTFWISEKLPVLYPHLSGILDSFFFI